MKLLKLFVQAKKKKKNCRYSEIIESIFVRQDSRVSGEGSFGASVY